MKYLTLYALLAITLFPACFERDELEVNLACDDKCITIYGTINTDQNSSTPLPNADIELGWQNPGIPIGDPGRLIARGTSDSNGNYSFTFKPDAKELTSGKYYLSVFKDQYYEITNSYYDITTIDTSYNFNLHLPSKAKLMIKFKNFTPIVESDYFSVIPQFDTYNSSGLAMRMHDLEGEQKNTWFNSRDSSFNEFLLFGETAGNQYTYFNILIKKNGSRVDMVDSVYVERNETGMFEIEY